MYGKFVEECNAGGVGWPGGVGHLISGPDGAYVIEANIETHIWAARPIEEDVYSLSNAPQIGNSFTMSVENAQEKEGHYWNFEHRLPMGRALATRMPLMAAHGHVTPETMMRVMSASKGDQIIPDKALVCFYRQS